MLLEHLDGYEAAQCIAAGGAVLAARGLALAPVASCALPADCSSRVGLAHVSAIVRGGGIVVLFTG